MNRAALDPRELLEQLKAEHQVLQWSPLAPQEIRTDKRGREPGVRSSLDYLHQHWALTDTFEPASATSSGLRGRAESLFGRLTYRVLRPYFRQERELLSRAVQVIDDLDQRCSELTVRVSELGDAMSDRQVAEAENQAKLALWLHLAPPAAPSPSGGLTGAGDGQTTSPP